MATMNVDETVSSWREELLGFLEVMYKFRERSSDPKEILIEIASFSIRARYMCAICAQYDNRKMKDFKFEEALPFLQEAEFQRQTWSRIGSLIKDEWDMAKG